MKADLAQTLKEHGFILYPRSVREIASGRVFVARRDAEKFVGLDQEAGMPELASVAFHEGSISLHRLTWENYTKLRDLVPISPSTCDGDASFGTGDRLGMATAAHLEALSQHPVFPVIAQQSPRELVKTGRDFRGVLLDAVMGLLESGYQGAFGADADHIKDETYLAQAIEAGYSMYTIDVSDSLRDASEVSPEDLSELSGQIVEERGEMKVHEADYVVSDDDLMTSAQIYDKAMEKAVRFYGIIKQSIGSFDFEISVDEGERDTTVEDHLFVAEYLHRSGIEFSSLAPKLPGQFQKAVDYEGDLGELALALDVHGALCRQLGGYRLSLHSGSDKFSIYPLFAEETGDAFHIKTSGTSWLEAVKVVARVNPALFEELYQLSLEHLDESKKSYHVGISREHFPEAIPDDRAAFLALPEVRQLLHISYGALLDQRGKAIRPALWENEREHYDAVVQHIKKHLNLLFR